MQLVKFRPYRSLISLPEGVERFFSDLGFDAADSDTMWSPSVDLSESENTYEVKAEIPGMKKEDIRVSYEDNVLTLTGEKKQEKEVKNKNYHRVERAYGRFQRSFRLPKTVNKDEIKAKYKDGVLTVEIPKAEAVKPKEIAVG